MKKLMQKIDSFAKRFFKEISETDVLPEYDINNPNFASAESINDNMLDELNRAQNDTMNLYSDSVDPNYKLKAKKEINVKKQDNLEKRTEVNHGVEKTKEIEQIRGKELDR